MLSIAHYQRNANQNYNEVSSHTSQTGHHQEKVYKQMLGVCGEIGTLLHCWWECSLIQPLWKTVQRFLKKLAIKLPYDPAIPLWAYTSRKPSLKKTHVHHCSLQHCLQQLGHGGNLDVHQWMNGERSCSTYTHWNITQP